jgi:hypothetical protein
MIGFDIGSSNKGDAAGFMLPQAILFHFSDIPFDNPPALPVLGRCGVQRIARRSRVMPEHRIQQLDSLQFDWTGADPLS